VRAQRAGGDTPSLLESARRDARVSKSLFSLIQKKTVRQLVLDEGIRIDGRGLTDIRPISVEVGLVPRAHGSGLFTRGDTQALTVATLGSSSDVQRIDTISPETEKRYLHHYNFPPYSTGENKPMRGPSRRDIGHGHLAERALVPVLPDHDDFPYVIRLVSECVTSNGSTSMASTCGSTLALMDAGVPIKAPVAGAAMGLISEPDGRFVVLTDILGKEDSIGDMDFKVTGTRDGVTALQMDIKVQGISEAIIRDGLKQALTARLTILDKMADVLPEARPEMSDFAPRIITIKINPEKIREIIGKGGSMIRKIQEETQTEINVEDDGTVEIAAVSGENSRKAIQWIESLTREVEVGALYLGKVTRIMGFGAFVEILPGKEGLVRIGELADYHVPSVEDVVSIGDEVMVVVTEIDRQGRVNLSRKAAMQRHLAKEPVAAE
ncbi:MAG: polyribonucleotide nucleotidyltransferase, partial [Chloroflexota bacterium]